jgi:hypothetical protein
MKLERGGLFCTLRGTNRVIRISGIRPMVRDDATRDGMRSMASEY